MVINFFIAILLRRMQLLTKKSRVKYAVRSSCCPELGVTEKLTIGTQDVPTAERSFLELAGNRKGNSAHIPVRQPIETRAKVTNQKSVSILVERVAKLSRQGSTVLHDANMIITTRCILRNGSMEKSLETRDLKE